MSARFKNCMVIPHMRPLDMQINYIGQYANDVSHTEKRLDYKSRTASMFDIWSIWVTVNNGKPKFWTNIQNLMRYSVALAYKEIATSDSTHEW